MTKTKLTAEETKYILDHAPNSTAVSLSFGPRGLFFDIDDPENAWALPLLHEYRFPEQYMPDGLI